MNKIISAAFNLTGIKSNRTKNIVKHVGYSFFFKGGSIITTFLLVPLTISFLNQENYGIWLTINSFIAWFSFFDVGLGHGLRNKFAEAKAKGDLLAVKKYISTAYYSITGICLILFLIFLFISSFVEWANIFNTASNLNEELALLIPIVFGCFCLRLILNLIITIYTADQHHSVQGKVNFFSNLLLLISIFALSYSVEGSLILFGVLFSSLPIIILIFINGFAFHTRYKNFRPSLKFWNRKDVYGLFGLGFQFFFIQLSGIILFSTDNFLITHLFGPEEVVPYDLSFKYFSISVMVLNMILAPFWSSITEAYTKNDFEWLKISMRNLVRISGVAVLGVLLMLLLAPWFYNLWIGDSIEISSSISIFMAVYFILTIIYSPFTYFINGTGKIRLQMFSLLISAIVNIPFSIFLANLLGVKGIIIATSICILPHTVLCFFQYKKIINKAATGLWNK